MKYPASLKIWATKQKKESGKQIGDKVCALLGGGGYAEYVCAPYGMVMPIPKNLSFEEAASLPEAYAILENSKNIGKVVLRVCEN